MNSNIKKSKQLGMPFGTASARLRKSILFQLLRESNKNICYQCGNPIESEEELSIEHKTPWLDSDNPRDKFFDLSNIAFSHLACNISAARRAKDSKRESHRKRIIEGRHHNTKIDRDTLLKIRAALKELPRKEVQKIFNLSKTGLAMIARGETFSYIE